MMTKNAKIFLCEKCNFKCSKQSDWDRHILTRKHENSYKIVQQKTPIKHKYHCICDKSYNHRQNLNVHKKTCKQIHQNIAENPNETIAKLLKQTLKQNAEIKEQNAQIIEMAIKNNNSIVNVTNNTINTNNNVKFNLNVFLNETCKDALNLSDLLGRITVTSDDLELTGEIGFVKGVSKLFLDQIKLLEIPERPIHCSDAKRETMYIKNDGEWKKDEKQVTLKKAVGTIAGKNMDQLFEWMMENPGYGDSTSPKSDIYLGIVSNMDTLDSTKDDYLKVVKALAKETIIDKNDDEEQIE